MHCVSFTPVSSTPSGASSARLVTTSKATVFAPRPIPLQTGAGTGAALPPTYPRIPKGLGGRGRTGRATRRQAGAAGGNLAAPATAGRGLAAGPGLDMGHRGGRSAQRRRAGAGGGRRGGWRPQARRPGAALHPCRSWALPAPAPVTACVRASRGGGGALRRSSVMLRIA